MADNVIRVNVTTVAPKSVTIQGSKEQNYINATGDTSGYNAQLAKNWAIGEGKIQGIDYSSKHYAGVAKENAELSSENLNNVQEIVAGFGETAGNATSELAQVKNDALIDISNLNSSVIEGVESSKDTAISAINTAKIEGLTAITTTKNEALTTLDNKKAENITAIQTEGKKQVENIESTGFYMRDDKLYFINSKGEEEEFKSGGAGLQMFDTVLKDHVLTYEESKGLALQGTWVYKEAVAGSRYGYPDFYAKCLEEKNAGTATEVTLAGTTITMYISSNGHAYYDIADKSVIDTCFSVLGMAWWYGIDTENERVFLPRNNWFEQATGDVSEINTHVEAGLPNITGDFYNGFRCIVRASNGAFYPIGDNCVDWGGTGSTYGASGAYFNASRSSSVYGKSNTVQPNAVKKLLYICVGNTEAQSSVTDVVDVTTTENDTIPLGYSTYQNGVVPNTSWLKSQGQWNDGNLYTTFYNVYAQQIGQNFASGKVVEYTDTYTDYDLVINQDDMTFRLPLLDGSEVLPSDRYVDLTLNASGSTYTAPANGWFEAQADSICWIHPITNMSAQYTTNNLGAARGCFPCAKGDQVLFYYSSNVFAFRFIYATGNGSLYFKVANAVQNLELLDAGEVLDAVNNVIPNNSSLISGLAMPSNKYIDLTVGASGTAYTAPANGWFEAQADSICWIHPITNMSAQYTTNNLGAARGCFPCAKGDQVLFCYSSNVLRLRFIYAESEV